MQKVGRKIIFGAILVAFLMVSSVTLVPQSGSAQMLKNVKKVEQAKEVTNGYKFALRLKDLPRKDLKILTSIIKKVIGSRAFKNYIKEVFKSKEFKVFIEYCKSLLQERYGDKIIDGSNCKNVFRNNLDEFREDKKYKEVGINLRFLLKEKYNEELLNEIHLNSYEMQSLRRILGKSILQTSDSGDDLLYLLVVTIIATIAAILTILTWPVTGTIWGLVAMYLGLMGLYIFGGLLPLVLIIGFIFGFVGAPLWSFIWVFSLFYDLNPPTP